MEPQKETTTGDGGRYRCLCLRFARIKANLTLDELARKACLPRQHLIRLENGTEKGTMAEWAALETAMGIARDKLRAIMTVTPNGDALPAVQDACPAREHPDASPMLAGEGGPVGPTTRRYMRPNLRKARLALGYTQKELGRKVGLSDTMIRDLEFCNSDTTAANWDKLEAILGVDLAVLRVKAFFDCRALTPNRRLDRERYLALRKIRVGKGLSMARLAQMAGVTPGTISALETCGYRGSARVWARLEIALGVDQKILRSFCRIDPLDAKRPEAAGPDGQQDAAPQAPLAVADPVSLDADPGDPAPPATGRGPIFLRRARIGKGITQKRLARMVGAKSRAVSSIETGRYGGSAEFWAKTEAAMGIGRETLRAIDLEPIDAYLLRDTHGRRSLPPMRGNIHRGAIPRNRGAMLGRAAAALAVIAAIIVGVWNW